MKEGLESGRRMENQAGIMVSVDGGSSALGIPGQPLSIVGTWGQ